MGVLDEFTVRSSVEEFSSLCVRLSSVMSRVWEERFREEFLRSRSGALERAKRPIDVFSSRAFILPDRIRVEFPAGTSVIVSTVSNPALRVKNRKVTIYLRVSTLGSWFGRTFISIVEFDFDELKGVVDVEARMLIPALMPFECVEDPRVDVDSEDVLYHVRGFYTKWLNATLTFVAKFTHDGILLRPVAFSDGSEEFILRDFRDTFPLNSRMMILRPYFRDLETGGIFVGPREGEVVDAGEVKPIPELMPGKGELKTGGNCVIPISKREYLLIYHTVDEFEVYRCYAAILNSEGEVLAYTPRPILVPDPHIYSGRRPGTVFPCGIGVIGNTVVVVAGFSDEIVVVYEGSLDNLLAEMREIK